MWPVVVYSYYYYFLRPTSTKPQAEILKLNKVNGCNDFSFGGHCVLIGDRIPPSESHGQALEQKCCFPAVFCDDCDAPANLLSHFYGCFMPCTRHLDGKRTEDVSAGQPGVLVSLTTNDQLSSSSCKGTSVLDFCTNGIKHNDFFVLKASIMLPLPLHCVINKDVFALTSISYGPPITMQLIL